MNNEAELLRIEALSLNRQGRRLEAIAAYRRLLELNPELAECWYNLGYLLKAEGRFEEALDAYAKALESGGREPEEVHLNRAVIYSDHLREEERARAELETALTLAPDYLPAWLNLGNLWEEQGEREEALSCYEQILAAKQQPNRKRELLEALARIAHLRPPRSPEDPLLERLKQAAGSKAPLDPVGRANLLFALGRALDRLNLFDDAFAAFEQANRLARSTGRVYVRSGTRRRTDQLITAFARRSARRQRSGQTSAEPLFICGMFRSGSTLVEQVLAAHPEVVPGGELDVLPRLADEVRLAKGQSRRIVDFADEYRAQLLRLFPEGENSRYITDKRPDNFLRIGLIKQLFPGARIVHTIRDPVDNCLSIYFQHLDQNAISYSSDLAETAHYYGQYRRLMNHWHHLHGADIHDFSYDAFVGQPEAQLRKLLEFLGLPWDDCCLKFHLQANPVKTASYWQIRRPLYKESSGRWKNYKRHLEPLFNALKEAEVLSNSPDS